MPSTLSMAATFSRRDAEATGTLIGRDARALGIDVILQPLINLYRDPTFECAYNTFGEDPVLTGALAAEFVRRARAQNVMAQAKHFVVYDGGVHSQVDGQTLREVYVSPFVDVSQAGVASIMCAYNKINGIHACGNGPLQNGILRGDDGFRGFITSDWGSAVLRSRHARTRRLTSSSDTRPIRAPPVLVPCRWRMARRPRRSHRVCRRLIARLAPDGTDHRLSSRVLRPVAAKFLCR